MAFTACWQAGDSVDMLRFRQSKAAWPPGGTLMQLFM
jgi:hypothetical protein